MRKDQLNQLVSSYKSGSEEHFPTIYKAVQPMINYVKKRFNKNFICTIDFESVAGETLIKAISCYKESKGNFSTHFINRLRAEVTREGIKNMSGLRLPEYLAKKDFQISEEAKNLMLSGKAKQEIMEIYNLTESEYHNLLHYYTEVPKYLEYDASTFMYDDSNIHDDVNYLLDNLPESYRAAIIMYFGLQGSKAYSPKRILSVTGVNIEEVLEYLKTDREVKSIMGEYNV